MEAETLYSHRHSKEDLPIGAGPGNIPDNAIMAAAIAAATSAVGTAKKAVLTVATAPILLTGEQLINGVLTNVSRVGVVGQADPKENGLFTSSPGPWTRTLDADSDPEVVQGMFFWCIGGSLAGWCFILQSPDPISLGVSLLTFLGVAPNLARVEKTITPVLSPYLMAPVPGVDDTLIVDTTLGPVAVVLPPAAAFNPASPDRRIKLVGPNPAAVACLPGDNADGLPNFPLVVLNETRVLQSNGGVTWRNF